jgi:hypothetical protein
VAFQWPTILSMSRASGGATAVSAPKEFDANIKALRDASNLSEGE